VRDDVDMEDHAMKDRDVVGCRNSVAGTHVEGGVAMLGTEDQRFERWFGECLDTSGRLLAGYKSGRQFHVECTVLLKGSVDQDKARGLGCFLDLKGFLRRKTK
jgi:hypothetical protein